MRAKTKELSELSMVFLKIFKHGFLLILVLKSAKKNTGLGRSICQHIIESHQGLITCTNGEKTTFYVRLPMVAS